MPRDGSETYVLPFPDVEEDTTIESAVYNGFTNDVAQDLNNPRPINSGGTGATNAYDARQNIDAEVAGTVVTNYDSHVWEAGSFYSLPGATGAPASAYLSGVCDKMDDLHINLIAREFGGLLRTWTRQKSSGVWGAWVDVGAATNAAYVSVTGDTMTGNLTIVNAAPIIEMAETDTGNRWFTVVDGSSISWRYNTTASNNFNVTSAGANLIGSFGTSSDIYAGGNLWTRTSTTAGALHFGNSGTKYLSYDGTNFTFNGGTVVFNSSAYVNGGLQAAAVSGAMQLTLRNDTGNIVKYFRVSNAGTLEFINNANSVILMSLNDGGGLSISNGMAVTGNASVSGICTAGGFARGAMALGEASLELGSQTGAGSAFIDFHTDGTAADFNVRLIQSSGGNFQIQGAITETQGGLWSIGYRTKPGLSAGYGSNYFNIHHGTGQQLWIDNSNVGTFAYTSDYRTKKDVVDLSGTWDMVKALRPIRYTHKDFTPPSEQDACAKSGEPFMKGDNVEQWGFIAHELQETLTESASSGVKDSPDTIQSPNPWTVIAALTKALQEAMTRIEQLEAA